MFNTNIIIFYYICTIKNKKNNIKFIRFGDLSPIKQTGFKKETFHSAPTNKGFYAFIDFLFEPFLLGGYNPINTKYSKRQYIKNEKGEKVIIGRELNEDLYIYVDDLELDRLEKRYFKKQQNVFIDQFIDSKGYIYITTMKRPKRFEYKKELWHHLINETPHNLVLKRSKDWILTDYKTFKDALNLALHKHNSFQHDWIWDWKKGLGIPPKRRLQFTKDRYEVFIERL